MYKNRLWAVKATSTGDFSGKIWVESELERGSRYQSIKNCLAQRRKEIGEKDRENSKLEIRNSKQFGLIKNAKHKG